MTDHSFWRQLLAVLCLNLAWFAVISTDLAAQTPRDPQPSVMRWSPVETTTGRKTDSRGSVKHPFVAQTPVSFDQPIDVEQGYETRLGSDVVDLSNWSFGGSCEACDACDAAPRVIPSSDCFTVCGRERFWVHAEYLYWRMRGPELPPLVTTSSEGTLREDAGVLGQSTTTVLLGNNRFRDNEESGGRLELGYRFNESNKTTAQFLYTSLSSDESFSATSGESAILARPFYNVDSGLEDARLLGFPDEVTGRVSVSGNAEYSVYEVLVRSLISARVDRPTYLLCGYRMSELDDSLRIDDSSLSIAGATAGASLESQDRFDSENRFHGVELGIEQSLDLGSCWSIQFNGKAAFGETTRTTTISGQSTATNSVGDSSTISGGLLSQPTNIGRFESSSHGVIHDLTVRLRRESRKGLSVSIGYAIQRWQGVMQAADQLDRQINPTQIPPATLVGAARPRFLPISNDFLVQGLTVGVGYRW